MPLPVKKKGEKTKILWTQTVSRNQGPPGMKYRPPQETPRQATKGKLPCIEAASVQQIILMMIVHICRKIIYGLDISYRICFYILGTLLLSVVSDYKTKSSSRGYFGRSDNFLNQWFVKIGWFWTLLIVGSFVYLTSMVISCGRQSIVRNSLARLGVASFAYFCLTTLFDTIEHKSGLCDVTKYRNKAACLASGNIWKGFDISGHCFLLVFSNLVMVEEGKAYLGWERIRDFLRTEEHSRVQVEDKEKQADTPLSKLKNEEFMYLRTEFPKRTPWVRLLFCLMAGLMILWDVMLLCTVLYFHMMIEKVVASGVAVLLWFSLYKVLYQQELSPGLPGTGLFRYCTWKEPSTTTKANRSNRCKTHENVSSNAKWSSKDEVPKFMGMPLYALKDYKEEVVHQPENLTEEEVFYRNSASRGKRGNLSGSNSSGLNVRGRHGSISELQGTGRSRSRSQSRSRPSGNKDFSSSSKNKLNHVNPVHF